MLPVEAIPIRALASLVAHSRVHTGCTTRRMCSPARFSAPRSRSSPAGRSPDTDLALASSGCLSGGTITGRPARGEVAGVPDSAGCAPGFGRRSGGQASHVSLTAVESVPSAWSIRGCSSGCRLRRAGALRRARQARGAAGDGEPAFASMRLRSTIICRSTSFPWWMLTRFRPDADDDLSVGLFRHRPDRLEQRLPCHSMWTRGALQELWSVACGC